MSEKIWDKNFQQSRRSFLFFCSSTIASSFFGCGILKNINRDPSQLTHLIALTSNGKLEVTIHKSELGQGIATSFAQMIAEELEYNIKKISLNFLDISKHIKHQKIIGSMNTVASNSVITSQELLRVTGATAKNILIYRASKILNISTRELYAKNGAIYYRNSKKFRYKDLVHTSFYGEIPKKVILKRKADWKIIGKPIKNLFLNEIVNGKTKYVSDIKLPNMLHASIKHCPVNGGFLKNYHYKKSEKRKEIKKIIKHKNWVAVIATNWWEANIFLEKINFNWITENKISQNEIKRKLVLNDKSPSIFIDKKKEVSIKKNVKKLIASYYVPYATHVTMETPCAVALFKDNKLFLWTGSQNPEETLNLAKRVSKINPKNIFIKNHILGGSFGRKGQHQDFVAEAILIAMQLKSIPIKLQWSREEDIKSGLYRPILNTVYSANIENDKFSIDVLVNDHSVMHKTHPHLIKKGVDLSNIEFYKDFPYNNQSYKVSYLMKNSHINAGLWRGVSFANNTFCRECFIDELSQFSRTDPVTFRLNNLKDKKQKQVLTAVSKKIKDNTNIHSLGFATLNAFSSYVAVAANLKVDSNLNVTIIEIVIAMNCGHIVNTNFVKAQLESGVIWGLSSLFNEEITIKKGCIEQSNYDDYKILRINESPKITTLLMPSYDFWGGVGEPALCAVIPAVANAISRSTNKRIRSLPIKNKGYKIKIKDYV